MSRDRRRLTLRPPVGLPLPGGESRRLGFTVSAALHLVLVLLLLAPVLLHEVIVADPNVGAGGPGPAGGGGGGSRGDGGARAFTPERLHYIQVAPEFAAPPAAEEVPEPVPPEPEPEPEPVPEPVPEPERPALPVESSEPTQLAMAPVPGTGGGTGSDGTSGTGPGSGGGIGSGIGTGRGSSIGPGTGGGPGSVYPPQLKTMPIPPLPTPRELKGTVVTAYFEVDERGRAKLLSFTRTRSREHNEKLRETFVRWEFRAATRLDGTPVRDTAEVVVTLY